MNLMRYSALLSATVLWGCGAGGEGAGQVSVAPGGDANRCSAQVLAPFTPDFAPLPAASRVTVSPEAQSARNQLLGAGATDPDEVKVWWYGVASFIVSAGGHLFLLDVWEIVGLHQDYAPIGRDDLVALEPEAIFIGHGHFDHAGDLGYVAGRTGATVFAGRATCATAREQAARDGNRNAFDCIELGNASTPAPGTMQQIRVWEDMPEITILRHTHSAAEPEDLASGGLPLIFVPELLVYFQNLNTDPQEISWFLQSLDDESGNSPPGGTWAYHFRVGDFSLMWHDSAGPIADGKPFADEIQCGLDSFPDCVDVQLGTIVGFGALTSGLRDVSLYVRNAHPRVSLPNHHDAWAPVIGPGAEAYEAQWRAEIASMPNPPELDYLDDPEDYLRVRSYRVNDARWKTPMAGSSCARR